MKALQFVALGWALIAVDLYTKNVDVVPDPVGWALVLYGTYRLAGRGPWLRGALYATLVATVISLASWFPETAWRDAAELGSSLAEPVVIVVMLTGLILAAEAGDDTKSASRMKIMRKTIVICLLGTVALGIAVGGAVLMVLVLLNLLVLLWFIATMYDAAKRTWAQPAD